jgi:flagellin
MERLSSGKKINSAADDAAGFAIAERMTAQIRGLNMAAKNASDGLSMLATIENATNDVTDMLQRIRELAVQAVNDTNGGTDRAYLQLEVDSLLSEINRVGTQTVYNNKTLLNGSLNGHIQVGTDHGQNIEFSIDSIQTADIGTKGSTDSVVDEIVIATGNKVTVTIGNVSKSFTATGATDPLLVDSINSSLKAAGLQSSDGTGIVAAAGTTITKFKISGSAVSAISVKVNDAGGAWDSDAGTVSGNGSALSLINIESSSSATDALKTISSAIEQVAGHRASYGALQNRLEYTVSNLMNVAEFTTAARSRIEDADFAAESAKLAKAQVLQQTGTAMLAQANAASQLALQLIR